MSELYGIALLRKNGKFILKTNTGEYFEKWDIKQDVRKPLNKKKLRKSKTIRLKQ